MARLEKITSHEPTSAHVRHSVGVADDEHCAPSGLTAKAVIESLARNEARSSGFRARIPETRGAVLARGQNRATVGAELTESIRGPV